MSFWEEIISNKVLVSAILGWVIAQILKVIYNLITIKKFDISRLVGSGGMPSSHSAFVGAMATSVGITEGFGTTAFAIAFVISFIVMYDASGVRKAAGEHAKVINDLQKMLHMEVPVYLKELLGHTWLEVVVGCILGIIIGVLMCLDLFV